MKSYILAALAILFIGSCNRKPKNHNPPLAPTEIVTDTIVAHDLPKANNSLAYLGLYKGKLPCADCLGIETSLELSEDFTYTMNRRFIGNNRKPDEQKGTFSWNHDETSIILDNVKDGPNQFRVGEKILTPLDNKNAIKRKDSSEYLLKKMTEAEGAETDAMPTPKNPK